jgi:hypothetical protein
LTGKIFLLDKGGKRMRDINAPNDEKSEARDDKPINGVTRGGTQKQNQAANGDFKVGDRVEVISGGKWYPGTVTRGLENNAYKVEMDKDVGKGLPDYGATPNMIRALTDGSSAPVAHAIPPKRDPISCPEQPRGKAGPPALSLLKKLIQCSREELSTERGIINFDLQSAQIGAPRPWREAWSDRDMGTGIPGQTLVYPVRGRWTVKTYSADGNAKPGASCWYRGSDTGRKDS